MTVKPSAAAFAAIATIVVLGVYQLRDEHDPTPVVGAPADPPVEAAPEPLVAGTTRRIGEKAPVAEDDGYAYAAETIGAYTLRKDRHCDAELVTLPNADGTATEALRCTPRAPRQRPYQHYDTASLRQMAYGDPEAAAELGYRLIDSNAPEGTKYLLRAVALDPGYANEIETIRHAVYPPEVNVDNQLELAAGSYLFAMLRARIDGDYGQMLDIAGSHFRDSGGTEAQRALLETRAAELYEHVRSIRKHVVGDDTLAVSP